MQNNFCRHAKTTFVREPNFQINFQDTMFGEILVIKGVQSQYQGVSCKKMMKFALVSMRFFQFKNKLLTNSLKFFG